jgi:hypothetical protein
MGQVLVEATQEALEHSEGKIELKTSRLGGEAGGADRNEKHSAFVAGSINPH